MQEAFIVTCGSKEKMIELEKSIQQFFLIREDAVKACDEYTKKLSNLSSKWRVVPVYVDLAKMRFTNREANWTGFVVDVEATGPIPGMYSMVDIGVVKLDQNLKTTFRSKMHPLNDNYEKSALDVIGLSISELLTMEEYAKEPSQAMMELNEFIIKNTEPQTYPMFFSDNNGFDWMFSHWYFINFLQEDPFGHTSRNIADLFRGMNQSVIANFKKLRDTKHTHNPVDDAMGNAEALIKFVRDYGLRGLDIP